MIKVTPFSLFLFVTFSSFSIISNIVAYCLFCHPEEQRISFLFSLINGRDASFRQHDKFFYIRQFFVKNIFPSYEIYFTTIDFILSSFPLMIFTAYEPHFGHGENSVSTGNSVSQSPHLPSAFIS